MHCIAHPTRSRRRSARPWRAHCVPQVEGNQPRLRRQLAALPWRHVEIGTPQCRDRPRSPRDPHPQGRHRRRVDRRRDRVSSRRPGHLDYSTDPPGLRSHWQAWPLAHRDRLRHHRPRLPPGPTRRTRRLDPRALADRERAALGADHDPSRGRLHRPYPAPPRRSWPLCATSRSAGTASPAPPTSPRRYDITAGTHDGRCSSSA
jgi:hypothetical protein